MVEIDFLKREINYSNIIIRILSQSRSSRYLPAAGHLLIAEYPEMVNIASGLAIARIPKLFSLL